MIFPAASTSTLTVVTSPADSDSFPDNRIAVSVGNNQVLRCVGSGNSIPPSVVWVRNGEQVVNGGRITITEGTTLIGQQRSSDLQITNFALSDAGVYQCIFTEGAEVITTTSLRLDAGWCTLIYTLGYITKKLLVLLCKSLPMHFRKPYLSSIDQETRVLTTICLAITVTAAYSDEKLVLQDWLYQ